MQPFRNVRKSGGGVIVNMASIAALVGIPDRFVYSTTKGAIMAMTLSVAKDYISGKYSLQFYFACKGAYTICRWIYFKKLSRQGKELCLKNYPKHNLLAAWQSPKKLLHWLYIFAAMRLLLSRVAITQLMADL